MKHLGNKPRVLVIGSFMMDLVIRTPRFPNTGETVIGTSFHRFPGGKGANQAVSAARLGAAVTMVGKVGADLFGDDMLDALNANGVDTHYVLRDSEAPTGVGSVSIDASGHNRIIVIPGANFHYDRADLSAVEHLFAEHDIVLLQLEMDIHTVEAAVEIAFKHGVPVILNPAPACHLGPELLAKVSYLTPNESEAEMLSGVKITDLDSAEVAASVLLSMGVNNVVITLGENGAYYANMSNRGHVSAFPTTAVDTVAAGDAFNAGLAVAFAQGETLAEAVRFANAVGALTVTKHGAIPSLPRREDVEAFLRDRDTGAIEVS